MGEGEGGTEEGERSSFSLEEEGLEEDENLVTFTSAIMDRINAATDTTQADIPVARPPMAIPLAG